MDSPQTGPNPPEDERPVRPGPPAGVRAGTKAFLALGALLLVFGVVLLVSVATGERTPQAGDELLTAPDPLLPATIAGYTIRPEPEIAGALTSEYRARSVAVERVEAASIPLRSSASSLFAATLKPEANPRSSKFRAGVISGAAGGFGIDLTQHPVRFGTSGGVVVYSTSSDEGRLFVWFFRDAFVQLFVPPDLATEAGEIQRVILEAQLVQIDAAAG